MGMLKFNEYEKRIIFVTFVVLPILLIYLVIDSAINGVVSLVKKLT